MDAPSSYQAIVVGGGISGLVCAYGLATAGVRTALVESGAQAGGLISSERVNGYLLERGPNSFLSTNAALELLAELGIAEKAELQSMADHDRYVWRNGKLRRVPTGPLQLITSTLLSMREKYEVVHGMAARFRPPSGDMELGKFCRERFGNGAVDTLVKPGIAGIYAADADRISLESTAAKLFPALSRCERIIDVVREIKAERQANTAPRTTRSLVSFSDGLVTLASALERGFTAAGGTVLAGTAAATISALDSRTWMLQLGSGDNLQCERLVLCVPSYVAAELLKPLHSGAAKTLEDIEYAGLAIVHAGATENQFRNKRTGFGFLTVQRQGVRALGAIWSDRIFKGRAPTGHRLLTMFYGGEIDPAALELNDTEMRRQVGEDLKTTMGFSGDLELLQITRLRWAIPVFRVGHASRMREVMTGLPRGVELLGNYVGGVSVPDRIDRANETAQRIVAHFSNERLTTAA